MPTAIAGFPSSDQRLAQLEEQLAAFAPPPEIAEAIRTGLPSTKRPNIDTASLTWREIAAYAQREIASLHLQLEEAPPDKFTQLQGEARALRKLLSQVSPPRDISTRDIYQT